MQERKAVFSGVAVVDLVCGDLGTRGVPDVSITRAVSEITLGTGSRLDSGNFAGLSRGFRGGSVGVLTVIAMAFLCGRRGVVVLVGLSGHTCGSEHSMSVDCVRRVRAVRNGASGEGSGFVCVRWRSVPIQ